jgi:DHA2 family multidrug resistance protein
VLEEGPRNDWFGDDTVLLMAWVSGLSAIVFFVRVLTAKFPIVDLHAFRDRNFGLGSLFSFVLGIGLYGLTYLYPVYLAQIRGHNALMIGETLFVSGVFMFLTAPIAGRLMTRVDPRYMLMAGFLSFAVGTWWMTYLTKDWDFWELFWPQAFRGVGLMIAMIPINNIALGTLAPERMKNASGLFNLTRNLGGAVGLAALTTILNDRTDLHLARLHEAVTWARQPALEALNNMTQRFSSYGSDAQLMAIKQLNAIAHRQGVVMAFADVFLVLTVLFVGLAFLALVMKRPAQAVTGGH